MSVVAVVLAAGRGARFAEADPQAPPKMLALIDGMAMVRRTVLSLVAGGVDRCVVVVDGERQAVIAAALADLPVTCVLNPAPSRGMFSSVQCGVAMTGDRDLCLVMPGDMPYVRPETIAAVVAAARGVGTTISPRFDGRPGHPVALSPALRDRILRADVTSKLSDEMANDVITSIVVDDPGVRRDIDRPSDGM